MQILLGISDPAKLDAVRALLEPAYRIVGTATDAPSLVEAAVRLQPEIIVLDAFPDGNRAARQIKHHSPSIKLVLLNHNKLDLESSEDIFHCADLNDLLVAIQTANPSISSVKKTRRHRILAADDDKEMRAQLSSMLAEHYHLVAIVSDGQQLVELAREHQPDLLLVDISMPVMNGFEAVERIKLSGVNSKVVFFTTNGSAAYVRKALRIGASGYVLKARANEELHEAIKAVLDDKTFVSEAVSSVHP